MYLWHTQSRRRYEQGLDDYEEAVARVDKIKEEQQKQQAYGMSRLQTMLTLIETASNVWNKVSNDFEQKQSTITDKSDDRPTNDLSNSIDKSGKSQRFQLFGQSDSTKSKHLIAQSLFHRRFIDGQ